MSFSYKTKLNQGIAQVNLIGRLIDKDEAESLFYEVKSHIDRAVIKYIIDLSELEYMNSSGLNVLVNILTKVRNAGGEMVICSVSDRVNDLLIMTKLNTVFSVVPSIEEAKSAVENSMQE